MRRIIQSSVIILLSVCATAAFAGGYDYTKEDLSGYSLQPNFKVSDESDYSRDGKSVYFFGGYLYTYRFLNDHNQTVTNPTQSITYAPKNVTPNTFHGIEAGFGKELSRHFDAELAYLQDFKDTKNGTINGSASSISVEMNAMSLNVGYVFNPDDQFQAMAKAGVLVSDFHQTVTIANTAYYPAIDSTKIDPQFGLELIMYLTHKLAFRLSSSYALSTYGTTSTGQVDAHAGFSYIL